MVDELLLRMDRWLSEQRADYYSSLLPGASESLLADFEDRFSLRLPEDFRALYRWRNGQARNEFASLQENWGFSPLETIAQAKTTLDEMIGHDFDDPGWWRRGWVPFLANGGGDHLCLDLDAESGATFGHVICFWHDDEDRDVEFQSVADWLRELVTSMESGSLELA